MQHSPLVCNTRICSECCLVSFGGDLRDPAECVTHLQMIDALCVNDCKSLADALLAAGSAASKTSEDTRLGIELSMMKQRFFHNETRFQWVEGATMPADLRARNEDTSELGKKLLHTARCQIPRNLRDVGGNTTSS